MTRSTPGGAIVVALIALVVAIGALGMSFVGRSSSAGPAHMMGGDYGRGGMMGGYEAGPQPGTVGFVAGTSAAPRVVRILAGPGYTFSPSSVSAQRGETITFVVTTAGPYVHEFMVGAADAVAADRDGTPEVAGIGMMQTKTLTYTFDGPGPYAYACHASGHYEAGMQGTITVVG